MDVEIENYMRTLNLDEICRTCLSECNEMTSIYTELEPTEEDNISYVYQVLMNVASIQVMVDDGLPSLICKNCVENANNAFKFKVLCERSEALLQTYLLNATKNTTEFSENNMESTVVLDHNYVSENIDTIDSGIQHTEEIVEVDECDANKLTSNDLIIKEEFFEKQLPTKKEILHDEAADSSAVKIDIFSCVDDSSIQEIIVKPELLLETLTNVSQDKVEETRIIRKQRKRTKKQSYIKQPKRYAEIETRITEEGERKFKCPYCIKEYKHLTSLKVHIRIHTLERPYVCKLCPKTFRQLTSLTYHMRSHTGETPYQCQICEKKYRQSASLTAHMRVHTGQRPFLCSVCGKSFRQAPDLKYHMRTHTKEKPYMCSYCGKTMSMQSHLVQHLRIHTGERPYVCKECNATFPTSTRLKRHAFIHTDLKPFECEVCDRSFNRASSLKLHILTHSEEKPHICKVCKKGFIQQHSLRNHVKIHHNTEDLYIRTEFQIT